MLARDICLQEKKIEAVFESFCKKYQAQLLIIIGYNMKKRDILMFYVDGREKHQVDKMVDALCHEDEIGIEKDSLFDVNRAVLLNQGNVTWSRKKLLPIIMAVEDRVY